MGRRPGNSSDPKAPKPAASAQQLFQKARRAQIREADPTLSSVDVSTKLADEWRNMGAKQREPYVKKAQAEKVRFEKEMSKYVPDPTHLKPTKGGKRLQKDPARPKKPRSAYLYFADATRTEVMGSNPGLRIETLSKLIGQEWGKLTVAQKAPYEAQASNDKDRYQKEMKKYVPSEAYKKAQAAFKLAKKGGGSNSEADAALREERDELKTENKDLKKQIKELEKQVAKLEKQNEKLEAKAEKATEKVAATKEAAAAKVAATKAAASKRKAAAPKPAAKKAKQAKPAKPAKKEPKPPPTDDAHYIKWTSKMIGKNGDKATKEMLSAFKDKGAKGLAKLLTKQFKADRKK